MLALFTSRCLYVIVIVFFLVMVRDLVCVVVVPGDLEYANEEVHATL